ncbi:MAG: hypothetical protein C0597_07050, partial [Marinilabiliales bacterium]
GTTIILVTAEDGTTEITYEVNFTVAPNNDATLSDLKINGSSVSGFNSSTLTYDIELSSGTTLVPAVTATTNDINAEAVVTDATALPGTTSILVTAEDGTTEETYEINFSVATGFNRFDLNGEFAMYPNPTNGEITISFENKIKASWKIEVYNSLGSVLYTEDLSNFYKSEYKFDFSNFAKGIYLVKISNKDDAVVKQLIIK